MIVYLNTIKFSRILLTNAFQYWYYPNHTLLFSNNHKCSEIRKNDNLYTNLLSRVGRGNWPDDAAATDRKTLQNRSNWIFLTKGTVLIPSERHTF